MAMGGLDRTTGRTPCGQYNYGHYLSPGFNDLIHQAAIAGSPPKRRQLYIEAERLLCETDAAVIPLFFAAYRL
jgi:ABC-type oligopeptide transport system substrate-binding subunit